MFRILWKWLPSIKAGQDNRKAATMLSERTAIDPQVDIIQQLSASYSICER